MTNDSKPRLSEMFYATGTGFEDDRLEPLYKEYLSRSSLRCGDGLVTANRSFAVDRSNIQKRSRPLSANVTKKPRYHVQQMEASADDSSELRSKPFSAEAPLTAALSRFQEEKTLVHLHHEQISPKSSLTTRRYLVVQELFDTEQKYCSCLQLLQNHFAANLSLSAGVDQSDIRVIFPPCLRQILTFHGDFVRRLGSRLAKWTESSTVVDLIVFLLFQSTDASDCGLLKHYQTYFSLFRESLNCIRRLRQLNPNVEFLVKELERDERCQRLAIGAYLLTPIQRIPRYVLLLEQLAKCTVEGHPDYQTTNHCLEMLSEVLVRLNDSIVESSASLLDAESLPKRKRRFLHLNTFSFRQNSSSDVGAEGGGHTPYVKSQKDPNSLKGNRISLDFSFKKKRDSEFIDKKVLSEVCLNESAPVDYYLSSTLRSSTASQSFHAQERGTPHPPNPLDQTKRRIEQSDVQPTRLIYCDTDRRRPTTSGVGANGPYFSHADTLPTDVREAFVEEKKSRFGSLSRRLHLPTRKKKKKKRTFRRQTSVGDAIRNFFSRRGFSRRANYSRHSSTFDGNKDSFC